VVEGEVDETADVVVLVEGGEELDGFLGVEGESFEGDGFAPLFGERGVAFDYFFETQHFGKAVGARKQFARRPEFCFAECIAPASQVEGRRLATGAGFGKMLVELKTYRRTSL
jgi:hypothetical protein